MTPRSALLLALLAGCATAPPAETVVPTMLPDAAQAAPDAAAPAEAKPDNKKTVVDVAVGSPDHTTLVAALTAAGLVPALASPGGIYTVFAPTNAAFDALPAGTVDTLLKPENLEQLKKILKHHAAVPMIQQADMHDGATLGMSDGSSVTFHVDGDKVMVDGAHILGAVQVMNGIVYVVDGVLTPPSP